MEMDSLRELGRGSQTRADGFNPETVTDFVAALSNPRSPI